MTTNQFVKLWGVRVSDLAAKPGEEVEVRKADGSLTSATLVQLAPGSSDVWLIAPKRRA